jgi:hypothetical protein
MARKIIVFSTETNEKKELNSSATTWGELKRELRDNGLDASNMKGMTRTTKITLENDGAQLPAEEFTVFITPMKVKSGIKASSKKTTKTSSKRTSKVAPKKKVAKKVSSKRK